MRLAAHKQFALWEWVTLFGFAAAAIALTEITNLTNKWGDALVYSIILFGTVIIVLRPAWGRVGFWRNLLLLAGLHTLFIVVAVKLLPTGIQRLPWLVLTGLGMLEAVLLGSILWRSARTAERGKLPGGR